MDKVIKTLIFVTILLIPAHLVRFSFLKIPTNIPEILALLVFVLYFFSKKNSFSLKNILNFGPGKFIMEGMAIMFFGLLTATLLNDDWWTGFGIIKGWFAVPLLFGWVVGRSSKTVQDLKDILKWLYISIFLVATTSLVYYFTNNLTYDGRLSGFYNSPNFLAMYLAPALIIGVYLLKQLKFFAGDKMFWAERDLKKISKIEIISLAISYLIILCAFYFTHSYASWLAVVASFVIVNFAKRKKINRKLILFGLVILLLITIGQWNTEKFENLRNFSHSSLESRIIIWKAAGRILSDNLFWGIGPGNFQDKYLEYQKYFPPYLEWAVPQPHNVYLAFWLQTGFLGIIGFLILTIRWIYYLIRTQKNSQLAGTFLAIIAYTLIHGLVDTPYWKNDLAMVFWIVFFLGLKLRENQEKSKS